MQSKFVLAIVRWFDTSAAPPEQQAAPTDPNDHNPDWLRVMPFFAVHLVCFGVIWVGWSWTAVGVAFALYVIRMFAITGFYHRYFSHKTYKTSRFMQFVFAVVGNSSMQRGPLWWAANHRHHHQHSDDPLDIHSPIQHGFLWSHMLWLTTKHNFKTNMKAVPDLAKFPELMFLDRFDFLVPVLMGFVMFGVGVLLQIYAPALGTNGPQMLIWSVISTILLFHGTSTINSLSHLIGWKSFKTKDESRNNPVLALITLGEGWHNNHHRYASSTRQGFFWYEFDITYYGLVVLSWLGIVWDLNPVPERILDEARQKSAPIAEPEPVLHAAEPVGADAGE